MADNHKVLQLPRRPAQSGPESPPAAADPAVSSPETSSPPPAPPPAHGLGQYRVLLFHPQKGRRRLLDALRLCGLTNVTVTDNLEQAIQRVVSQGFDLILASHCGEARATTQLLEDLKGHQATAAIPLIAVTNASEVKEVLRIIAQGADEVLSEPWSQELLERKIQALLHPDQAAAERRQRLKTAQARLAEGHLPDAENLFQTLTSDPDLALEALLGLASVQIQRQRWGEAKALLQRAVARAKSAPDQIGLHRGLSQAFHAYGRFYQARQQPQPAAKSYRAALALNPFDIDNLLALLELLQREDRLDEVVKLLRAAAHQHPPYSRPLDKVAACVDRMCDRLADLGLDQQADRLFRELLGLKHQNPEVHLKTTDHLVREGGAALAVRSLVEICARLKEPELLHRLGTLLLENEPRVFWKALDPAGEGRPAANSADRPLLMARQAFHQAMRLEPDDPRHRLGLACVELKLGDTASAAEALRRVEESDLKNLRVYREVIRALIQERAYDLVGEWLREAAANFPEEPEVARLQAEYFLLRGDATQAVTALKKGLSQAPDDHAMLLTLARTYLQTREFGEAALYFERLIKLEPDDPRAREGLAAALAGRQG